MIKVLTIISDSFEESVDLKNQPKQKMIVDCSRFIQKSISSFDIEIEFAVPLIAFRNHDYTWVDLNSDRIASTFSPKIIKLENGFYVQANMASGIWEINKKNKKKLLWRFNPEYSNPLTEYSGRSNQKNIVQATSGLNFTENPALLFSKNGALEISRSKFPFSAIACFTDHCDFDTLENLKIQREFFKKNEIKVTKGFFLNHFSKREDNASFEKDEEELQHWKKDGHELCYHSLSQSIKTTEESFDDFENFIPPYSDIPVWIDHGYQPYNFSLYQKYAMDSMAYEAILKSKNISILWNYIDSGTSAKHVLNQLNPNHFTLKRFYSGIAGYSFKTKLQLMIKNCLFHFYGDEEILMKYKSLAATFKAVFIHRKFSKFPGVVKSLHAVILPLLKVVFFWNKIKNQPYKLSKYSPIIFKHTINDHEFTVFQTLEMVDFVSSLNPNSIQEFINEKGLFIAHTYFSVPLNYHLGKMIKNNAIDLQVAKNFAFLSEKIKQNEIWNPTLSELVSHLNVFEETILDIDTNDGIFIKNNSEICFRPIN